MGIIQRQGIKNFITTYSGFIIGFINLMILQPRFLSPEELGLTRILYSFSMLLAMFVPMGIGNATTRYFPIFKDEKSRHHGYFGFMLLFILTGFLIASGLLFFSQEFFIQQYEKESPLFAQYFHFVFPFILILALISCLNIYSYALLKSTVPAFLNDVFTRLTIMALVTIYFLKWISLDQFIMLFVGVYLLQLIILYLYIRYEDKPGFTIDWSYFREKGFRQFFSYGIILWFAAVASLGLKELGTIVLGSFMKLDYVAIYTIAAFIPTLIEAPLAALEKIAAPKVSYAWNENNRNELIQIYEKSTHYMLLIGGLLFLGINLNITELLQLLPEAYRNVESIVLIISGSSLINMATGLNAAILFYSDKYRYGAFTLIALVVIAFILQILFIPLWGLEGAAWATAISGIVYNAMNFFYVYKLFDLQPIRLRTIKAFSIIIVLYILLQYFPSIEHTFLSLALKSIVILVLYVGAIYSLKLLEEFKHYLFIFKR
ncbi:MAG TPA: polysaccharide biosynthesis C-terminal domain-containing protein [Bacteroidia bacterium]|nr:polysaccharide biosynthesis C-terminal domain-containing protein [Bacteroidia bacterium]